jgi:hypothetical protein
MNFEIETLLNTCRLVAGGKDGKKSVQMPVV